MLGLNYRCLQLNFGIYRITTEIDVVITDTLLRQSALKERAFHLD